MAQEEGSEMETWNREELQAEVWEHPLVKVAQKQTMYALRLSWEEFWSLLNPLRKEKGLRLLRKPL
jgi:hypothetical protein